MPDIDDDFDNRAYQEPDIFTDRDLRASLDAVIKPSDLFDDPDEEPEEYYEEWYPEDD